MAVFKYLTFWINSEDDLNQIDNDLERGLSYISQWKEFLSFTSDIDEESTQAFFAFQFHVYSMALLYLKRVYERDRQNNAELAVEIARCYRRIGQYDQSIYYYRICLQRSTENPQLLAELADVYAFSGEISRAKVFFREAFALSPQKIDLPSFESEMFCRLINKVRSLFNDEALIKEWIPIYGILWGLLSIKRELRPIEVVQLKQNIIQMEQEFRETKNHREIMTPRLLNHYFRLLDNYQAYSPNTEETKNLLLKIRKLSPDIYEQYLPSYTESHHLS